MKTIKNNKSVSVPGTKKKIISYMPEGATEVVEIAIPAKLSVKAESEILDQNDPENFDLVLKWIGKSGIVKLFNDSHEPRRGFSAVRLAWKTSVIGLVKKGETHENAVKLAWAGAYSCSIASAPILRLDAGAKEDATKGAAIFANLEALIGDLPAAAAKYGVAMPAEGVKPDLDWAVGFARAKRVWTVANPVSLIA